MPLIVIRSEVETALDTVLQAALRALRNAGIFPTSAAQVRDSGGDLYGQIMIDPKDLTAAMATLKAAGIKAEAPG